MSHYGRSTISEGYRKPAAFSFKKRTDKVDWRKIAAIDVNRIARELDFPSLQESIMSVTFCNIEAEMDSHLVDPNFVKLFQLAQLIIEYLMHSQQFLQSKLSDLEMSLKNKTENTETLNKEIEEKKNTVNHLKKENRKARKMVAEYQLMMRTGASGMHKCSFCPKVFVSNEYLLAHLQRRHAEHAAQFISGGGNGTPLKDTSNNPRRNGSGNENQMNDELLQELKDIKERLISTERQLQTTKDRESFQNKKEDKELEKIKDLEEKYALWKAEEQKKQKNEMTEFKNSVMIELRQVHEEKMVLEKKITDLQQNTVRPSLVRGIQDVDETDSFVKRQENMDAIKKELQNEVNTIQAHAQDEMKKMTDKWQKKESKMQKKNEADKEKYETMLKQFEQALEAERRQKQDMAVDFEQKMSELSKQMQDSQRQREKVTPVSQKVTPGKPPVPPSHDEHEIAKVPEEDETITLYVAFNGTNYQVRRSPSGISRDWSDQFSFNACLQPKQAFNYPLYVYSCGGSPYWRQYISTKSTPPCNEYRFDYVFYVASEALPRTTAYHVLEAGSVPVVKSCISKTPQLNGWRNTGIIFYVLKPQRAASPSKSLTRSGTFVSDTGTDGDESDDLSVSSLNTATESAKKNLAEAIEINRSKIEDIQQRPLPPPPMQQQEENDSESEEQSDLGTTLETGTFRPFETYPDITTRYNHKKETLAECRQEALEFLQQSLIKRGIKEGTLRLSTKQLESRMESFKAEHEGRAKKFRNFKEIRKRKVEEVNEMAQEMLSAKKSTRPGNESRGILQSKVSSKSSLKSAAAAIGAAHAFADRGRNSGKSPEAPLQNRGNPPTTTTTATNVSRSLASTGASSYTATTVTDPSLSLTDGDSIQEYDVKRTIQNDITDEGSDEDTDWDSAMSGDENNPSQVIPKVSVHIPSQKSQVQELASSLERSLESSTEIKKPVGAVALIHASPSGKRSSQNTDVKVDDFDDSDFLSSSPDPDESKPSNAVKSLSNQPAAKSNVFATPKKGVKFKMDNYSDFDDSDVDIDYIS